MNLRVGVGLERLVLTATFLDRQIEIASRRRGSMMPLRARLAGLIDGSGLRDRVVDPVEKRLEVERHYWIAAVVETLGDESCARVLEALSSDVHTSRDKGRDPWAPLDPDSCWHEHEAMRRRVDQAVARMLEASRRFTRTGRTSHLRDAVDEVDRALHVERDHLHASSLSVEDARDHGERLANALRSALPPPAFRFLASLVRSTIERELRLIGYELQRDEDHLLSTDDWARAADDEEPAGGVYFAATFQARYEEQMARDAAWREAREASLRDVRRSSEEERAVPAPPHHGAQDTVRHVRSGPPRPAGVPDDHMLVQLPHGPAWLPPAAAHACQAELDRRAKKEALREQRQEERRQYYALIGKRYPD